MSVESPDTPAPAESVPPADPAEHETKGDRRFAELSAKLAAATRERDRLAAESDSLRRLVPQQGSGEETPDQAQARIREQIRGEEAAKLRAERFHEEGAVAFPDWRARCDDLVAMGADPQLAQLLVEMPGGVQVAAALAKEPEEVQRIAGIRSPIGRSIALGKFAAGLDRPANGGAPAAPTPPPVTRAPAPVRPVTGRAAPVFNEYSATPNELIDHYMKQNLDRQVRR